jgi:hypothetical protein
VTAEGDGSSGAPVAPPSQLIVKDFSAPDKVVDVPKAKLRMLFFGEGACIAHMQAEDGWKWSECVKPKAGTELCMHSHVSRKQHNIHHCRIR